MTRQLAELFAPAREKWIAADHERACPQLGHGRKDRIEIAISCRMQDMELQPEGAGRRLHVSRLSVSAAGVVGFTSRAMTVAVGISSCISSSRFGPISTSKMLTPVRLPPGRFRLVTSPNSTGSNPTAKTIGIVEVAAFAAVPKGHSDDHGHLTANEVGRQPRQSIVLSVRPAVFDRDVLALDITGLFQAPTESAPRWLRSRRAPCC